MILVADDNEDNLQIIRRILRSNGFEVIVETKPYTSKELLNGVRLVPGRSPTATA